MTLVIALYFLAGGLVGGGVAGGKYAYDVARREAARDLQRRDRRALIEALRAESDLSDLRRRAAAVGADPDAVEQGYLALRDGRLTLDDLLNTLQLADG